jgi:tRNA A-37 threonylcarbamoyl transferase component Bud32
MNYSLSHKDDWTGPPNAPLTGFSSHKTNNSVRLSLWSDVFINEEIAIVMADMQGLFNNLSGVIDRTDNVKVFALGTLISSLQIFNLKERIQGHELEFLRYSLAYAKFLNENNSTNQEKPFQSFLFLMRDWMEDENFKYGFEGAEKYIENVMSTKTGKDYEIKVREQIESNFKKISCFLLPFPGDVVKNKSYDNRFSGLDFEFQENLKKLVESLFAPENLVAKRISGSEVSGKEYREHITKYLQDFQSPNQLEIYESFEKTARKQLERFESEALKLYNEYMENQKDLNEQNFKKFHEKAADKALEWFRAQKTIAVEDDKLNYESRLKSQIDSSRNERLASLQGMKIPLKLIILISTAVLLLIITFLLVFITIKRCRRLKRLEQIENLPLIDINDEKWHIEKSRIDQLYLIGKGNFGEVHKGTLKSKQNENSENDVELETVAIKTLKLEKDDKMSDDEFLKRRIQSESKFIDEARRMTKLDTHHIVKLIGFSLNDKPLMVVMEFMEHGDLKTFLMKHRENHSKPSLNFNYYVNLPHHINLRKSVQPEIKPLAHIALEIADGMAYLEKMKFVHRDLAARNCMVSSDFTIKIGDFGLTRFVDTSNYYTPQVLKDLPIRWMAPESITKGKYSSKSDVFSYGILLWELVTFGENPYPVRNL